MHLNGSSVYCNIVIHILYKKGWTSVGLSYVLLSLLPIQVKRDQNFLTNILAVFLFPRITLRDPSHKVKKIRYSIY